MQVLFKMGKTGMGEEIVAADLAGNRQLSFVGFTPQMFLEVLHASWASLSYCAVCRSDSDASWMPQLCILAGCDFLKALPGVGIKKAHAYIRKLKSFDKVLRLLEVACKCPVLPCAAQGCGTSMRPQPPDACWLPADCMNTCYCQQLAPGHLARSLQRACCCQVCRSLRLGGTSVPKAFEAAFQRSIWTFHHQRVYDPRTQVRAAAPAAPSAAASLNVSPTDRAHLLVHP